MNRLFTNNEVSNHPLLVAKDKKYEVIVPEPESETPPLFLGGGGFYRHIVSNLSLRGFHKYMLAINLLVHVAM